jgi:hypothetical protein
MKTEKEQIDTKQSAPQNEGNGASKLSPMMAHYSRMTFQGAWLLEFRR